MFDFLKFYRVNVRFLQDDHLNYNLFCILCRCVRVMCEVRSVSSLYVCVSRAQCLLCLQAALVPVSAAKCAVRIAGLLADNSCTAR